MRTTLTTTAIVVMISAEGLVSQSLERQRLVERIPPVIQGSGLQFEFDASMDPPLSVARRIVASGDGERAWAAQAYLSFMVDAPWAISQRGPVANEALRKYLRLEPLDQDVTLLYGALCLHCGNAFEDRDIIRQGKAVLRALANAGMWEAVATRVRYELELAGAEIRRGDGDLAMSRLRKMESYTAEVIQRNPGAFEPHRLLAELRFVRIRVESSSCSTSEYWRQASSIAQEGLKAASLHSDPLLARCNMHREALHDLARGGEPGQLPQIASEACESMLPDLELAVRRPDIGEDASAAIWLVRWMTKDEKEPEAFRRAVKSARHNLAIASKRLDAVPREPGHRSRIESTTKVLLGARRDSSALVLCGVWLASDGGGIELLEEATRLSANSLHPKYALANALLRFTSAGDERVCELLQSVVSTRGNFADARFVLGTALALRGDFHAGLEQLEEAAKLAKPSTAGAISKTIVEVRRALEAESKSGRTPTAPGRSQK